jgi:hypothetical protein
MVAIYYCSCDKFTTMNTFGKGPFIIYDWGWAGKIQLTTKQNVLPPPLHHKKFNEPLHMNSKKIVTPPPPPPPLLYT